MPRAHHRSTRVQLAQRLELVLAELTRGTSMADITAKYGRYPSTLAKQMRTHYARVGLWNEKLRRKQLRVCAKEKQRMSQREINSVLARLQAEESDSESEPELELILVSCAPERDECE